MIAVNFAARDYRFLARIRSGLVLVSVVLGLILAGICWKSYAARSAYAALQRDLRELESADAKALPVLAERERIVKDMTAMSGLLDARKLSWTKLLTDLEAVVPVGVALMHISQNDKDRTLILDGSAVSPEALRNLIINMEKSSAFKDPYLKHQSIDKGSISFNVAAVYRDDTRVGVVQGKR